MLGFILDSDDDDDELCSCSPVCWKYGVETFFHRELWASRKALATCSGFGRVTVRSNYKVLLRGGTDVVLQLNIIIRTQSCTTETLLYSTNGHEDGKLKKHKFGK